MGPGQESADQGACRKPAEKHDQGIFLDVAADPLTGCFGFLARIAAGFLA